MPSKNTSTRVKTGVIGAGSFGLAVASLIARNQACMLHVRNPIAYNEALKTGKIRDIRLHENIELTNDPKALCEECEMIFPIVPSNDMRMLIRSLSKTLTPRHFVVHGTKGFDIQEPEEGSPAGNIIRTMSEVIREESSVVRIGCIAGPNLAAEIYQEKPAGTVIASYFDEVIQAAITALRSNVFTVYGSNDLRGIELAGILKNYIAILSGALNQLNMGENARALLISRGLNEIVYIGKHFKAEPGSFLGLAGIGDLIATCYSSNSRNYTVGTMLASGMKIEEINSQLPEVAEGVKTVQILHNIAKKSSLNVPIASALFKVLYEEHTIESAVEMLMRIPVTSDAPFVKDLLR